MKQISSVLGISMVLLFSNTFATQTFYYSQNQANLAESIAKINVTKAKAYMPYIATKESISQNILKQQAQVMQLAVKQSNHIGATPITYESGEKYYIFSDQIKSDAIKISTNYKQNNPLDFNKTLNYYNQLAQDSKTSIGNNRLLIFVSYSMPKKQILQLIKDAQPLGAVFVFRGMIDGSLTKTQKEFMLLKQNYQVGAMINPRLFTVFGINTVPTFVLYKNNGSDILTQACNVTPTFAKISGSVSVRYALEELRKSTEDGISQLASNNLDLLDSNSFYNRR